MGGQSVNTKKLPNWATDDRKKSVEIVLGAAKIRAWANEYADDYYGDDRIKALLKNLDAIQEVMARENEAICDEAKRLRIALVADARSPKLFLLPDFDSAEFDLDAYQSVRNRALGHSTGIPGNPSPETLYVHPQNSDPTTDSTIPRNSTDATYTATCPDCGIESVSPKGKSHDGKQRFFCRNPKCTKQTFTVDLSQFH